MELLVFLMVLCFSLQPCAGEGEIVVQNCNFMESCFLPCTFQTGESLFIRWKFNNKEFITFYKNEVTVIEKDFEGRAFLPPGEISKGNATLQLDPVKVQDEGRYECFASIPTSRTTTFVELRVNAFPHRINIQRDGHKITCSAEGIYPRPHLTWSSNSSPLNATEEPKVLTTEKQLYNISSYVNPLVDEGVDYTCTVSTDTNQRRATLFRTTSLNSSPPETKIPCIQNTLNTSQTGLTWRFNHSEIILTQTTADAERQFSEKWKNHVKTESETRDLILKNLSSDHYGVYTCELSTTEEDYITHTDLKVPPDSSPNVWAIVGGALAVVFILAIVGAVCLCRNCRNNEQARGRVIYDGVRAIFEQRPNNQ